ncbi:MAG TPA: hypothetical protein VN681_05460, partial [Stellaceae bacterium]|nr:hypothetical protein [Stellaceae bacterium]
MTCDSKSILLGWASLVALAVGATPAVAASCESLGTTVMPPHAMITTAQTVTGGSFTPPGATAPLTGLPSFCRV